MVALEKLIEKGFKPKRGILVGLGFDEEISGLNGAANIAKYVEEHYGKNSVSILIDEGGKYFSPGPAIPSPTMSEVQVGFKHSVISQ
ncbi:Gly-Xaa carboxypeptidase [Ceratobasidium theobromae]|uniref:Gly-Xaa carboxypeptidase n=1 Tax=Ceratobasidium theobromae TaxID=1582974 RepID=A0A5N5Q776_9AGAM|nr:Gly-Xaa carboxypeptidase [Ceratobasidium theobromae]